MGFIKYNKTDGKILESSNVRMLTAICRNCGNIIIYKEGSPVPHLCDECKKGVHSGN